MTIFIMMQNVTNYHSHCSFCDGKAPMEEFVRCAVAGGYTAYGISSHAPLPFPTRWTLKAEQVPAYLAEIERLKAKYAGQIELYAGMEIDYLNEGQHPGIPYFQQLPLDYRIGSVHLVYTDCGKAIDTDTSLENFKRLSEEYFRGDLQEMVRRYFEASMRMVKQGGFDFIGHADKISYNAENCREGVTETGWYRKMRDTLFEETAEKGIRLEINTKSFFKRGRFFPDRRHFSQIRSLGIPVVVNSDAHSPHLIDCGRREALKALKEAGFRTVSELHGGHWEEMEIGI